MSGGAIGLMSGSRPSPAALANAVVLENGRDVREALSATMYHSAKGRPEAGALCS